MNPQNGNGWPSTSGPNAPPSSTEHHIQPQQRPLNNFGPNYSIPQGPPGQLGGPVLLPPSGAFFPGQTNGHAVQNLAGISQPSSLQPGRQPPNSQQPQSPSSIQLHHIQAPSYSLPALGQAMQQQSPQASMNFERERELREREREMRNGEHYERQRQHDIINQRERERDRELREQQQREQDQPSHENHTGSIPLQQPVASRVPSSLLGPNRVLSPFGASTGSNPPPAPLGAPTGPNNHFANGIQSVHERPFSQQMGHNMPPQQLLGFGGPVTPQQMPGGMAALSQGQQPILNDALSYLDQVKVRFVDHPDVYNRFLDIMKDFKSQAIDTPGVIDRVSNLFTGHPELIQGFNTFLPPGYKIECGTTEDPNAIRVTTPMGTTVSQMPSVHNRLNGGSNGIRAVDDMEPSAQQTFLENGSHISPSNWQQQQQSQVQTGNVPDDNFSPNRRSGVPLVFGGQSNAGQDHGASYDREEQIPVADPAAIAHQQEQRGVSHLSNAVSAATNGVQGRHSFLEVSPVGGPGVSLGQAAAGLSSAGAGVSPGNQLGMEKRGPVEFNHAISYVNKIKNRFASQPEIYKQFLEILQTYQRESKPIQDVYAQVTQLFSSAPDLLEDFKQFLPESAAQAKAQAAARQATEDATILSNVRGEPSYLAGAQHSQVQTPRPDSKLPPVGNFALTPSVGKENKKRRGGAGSQIIGGAVSSATLDSGTGTAPSSKNGGIQAGNANKRARIQQNKPSMPELPAVSPTLVPELPQPMPPTSSPAGVPEEFSFFDRVRKYIGNRQTFNEFLKLCNLFSQDLIDQNVLVHKAEGFLSGNNDLMSWFRNFIQHNGRDEIIENKPKTGNDKVVLSNCRGLGPSYRLLPERESLRGCSGRDEMCQQVLNDKWASHPTWASEDSGFVAHRKNSFEEALHRIEEERHDYDFNIEACARTIQLLEPIVQQIRLMSEEDRNNFVLPRGIGGQSETIYQRVIKKIYDRERGQKVIDDMFERPTAVVPILLSRLKQKAEEWKAGQREWEKVWREQTHKMFWRSLDHQGINAKTADKRQFQPKVLQTEIQAKYEEQKRQRIVQWSPIPAYQFQYFFDDVDVIQDACHILLTYLHHTHVGNGGDQSKLESFIKTFIPAFFDLDREQFQHKMSDIYDASPANEEVEDEALAAEDPGVGRGRRAVNGKKSNLLRGVLERGQHGKQGRKDKEGSAMSESKESTPDVTSMDDDAITPMDTPAEQPMRVDSTEHRWMEHPQAATGNLRYRQSLNHNEPFKRDTFNLYASLNIYCFVRMFEMLYERLAHIKANEQQVHDDVLRAKAPKPAHDLRLVDKSPSDFFTDVSPATDYYRQIVKTCEDVVKGESDANHLEETLRRFYLQSGWQLYTFDKMLAAIIRFALQILVSDNKDKSLDVINLFYKDRKENETTHQTELTYRKQVEKLVKEGDIFRIAYTRSCQRVQIQIFKKDDKTFETDQMATTARWSYYISTFVMRDKTEGMQLAWIQWPFLRRNMPAMLGSEEDYHRIYTPQWNEDGLVIRIAPNNYHMLYDPGTEDWWVHDEKVRRRGMRGMEEVKEERKAKFQTKFGTKAAWMAGMSLDSVDKTNEVFSRWIRDGEQGGSAGAVVGQGEQIRSNDGDSVMSGN